MSDWIVLRYTCTTCGQPIVVTAPDDAWKRGQTEFQREHLDLHDNAVCTACHPAKAN